ncbi:MAG TPA: SgcQ protein [Firmicutes bacterium]|jgi:hypothetical protein|nr:SgcQ protein [Bacillota bacterium]
MNLLNEMFGVKKPILGMVHFPPLPGSPLYNNSDGMKKIRETALRDAEALLEAGFNGLVFSNEGDRPYLSKVDNITVAAMSALITDVTSRFDVPFGLSVLADSEAAIAIGKAVGADFVRIFLSWVFVGDWGIVNPNAGKLQRIKAEIGGDMKVFANISGHTEPLGDRKLEDIARGAVKFGLADALCLAGSTAGSQIPEADLLNAKKGSEGAPVIAGTGVREENVARMLSMCDGAIMGTSLKVDGNTFNPIDPVRAKSFIKKANEVRKELS